MENRFAREVPEMAVAWQAEQAPQPSLLVLNEPVAGRLGLEPGWLRSPEGVQFLIGAGQENTVAQAYAGHQFGGYSPRLGDGRALLLGELNGMDVHLKGSGRTPFARGGDGRAVVGPMLREYVISEAMHALGIPTTRSLAVVATGRPVWRETELPGAILTRVASSHLRVGSFQYARATDDLDLLRRLADHAISRHYPELAGDYAGFFDAVVSAQARLIAKWMLAGFVHGVMNTDNMTISGETIDYGPCAFIEAYDPATVYSSIDAGGRYAYGNQPLIAQWNLARLAEALLPLLNDDTEAAVESLKKFGPQYSAAWSAGMTAKLGVTSAGDLVDDLLRLMRESRVDHTSFYRALARSVTDDDPVRRLFLDDQAIGQWLTRWRALDPDPEAMNRVNPVYIPRNHLVEQALSAATDGDLKAFEQLLEAVQSPYEQRPGLDRYATPAPPDFGAYQTFCGT